MTGQVDILGVGVVTAGGNNLQDTWSSLLRGADTRSSLPCPDGVTRKVHTVKGVLSDKVLSLASMAIFQALAQARRLPTAICVGSSSDMVSGREEGLRPEPVVDRLAIRYGIRHRYQVSTACSSSSEAIALAMDLINLGREEVVLAGGVDEVTFSSVNGFNACRIYSDRCRPFAKGRNGLCLADGAAFFILAKPGQTKPLARLTGAGLCSDAAHMVAMDETGVFRAINMALERSCTEEVDAIIAHGTGTIRNDLVEARAINMVWPEGRTLRPRVVSYKGVLGHPQGVSGAIGVALAVKAIQEQRLWGTVRTDVVDSELGLDELVTTMPTSCYLNRVMVLSHGTWGVCTALTVTGVNP